MIFAYIDFDYVNFVRYDLKVPVPVAARSKAVGLRPLAC